MEDLFMVLILVAIGSAAYFGFKRQWKKIGISAIVLVVSLVGFTITYEEPEEEIVQEVEAEEESVEEEIVEEPEEVEEEVEEEEIVEEPEEIEEEEPVEEVEVAFDPDNYNKELTYDDLARNPVDYMFENVTFEGKIIQVMKGDTYSQYRIITNGDHDKVMLIEIDSSKLDTRILKDDYIRFYGMYLGEITYESTLGGEITVPSVVVDEFEFQ